MTTICLEKGPKTHQQHGKEGQKPVLQSRCIIYSARCQLRCLFDAPGIVYLV